MRIDGIDLDPANLTQDLLELVVGERWPNGDEGAMRALATAWWHAYEQINEIRETASAAVRAVQQYCQGENGESFQSYWSNAFDDGRTSWPAGQAPAALPFAENFCQAMSQALNAGANQIETTKDTIMGNIAILVATVAPQIAAGFLDFGTTDATAVAEVAENRVVMEGVLATAKRMIGAVVKEAIVQGLMQAELNFLIQLNEVAEGHAGSIDWKQVGSSGLSGAEGGALGAGFGIGLGKAGAARFGAEFGESFLGKAATGVVSGQLTNATLDLLQNHTLSVSDLTKGSAAGLLGGLHGAGEAGGESVPDLHLDTPLAIDEAGGAGAGVDAPAALDTPAATELSGLSLGQSDTRGGVATGLDGGTGGIDPNAAQNVGVGGGGGGGGTDAAGLSSISRILGGGDSGALPTDGSSSGGYGSGAVGAPATRGYDSGTARGSADAGSPTTSAFGGESALPATRTGSTDSGFGTASDVAEPSSGLIPAARTGDSAPTGYSRDSTAASVGGGAEGYVAPSAQTDLRAGSGATSEAGASPSPTTDAVAGLGGFGGSAGTDATGGAGYGDPTGRDGTGLTGTDPSAGAGGFAASPGFVDSGGAGASTGVVDGGGSGRYSSADPAIDRPAAADYGSGPGLGTGSGSGSGRFYGGSRDPQGSPTSDAYGIGGTLDSGEPRAPRGYGSADIGGSRYDGIEATPDSGLSEDRPTIGADSTAAEPTLADADANRTEPSRPDSPATEATPDDGPSADRPATEPTAAEPTLPDADSGRTEPSALDRPTTDPNLAEPDRAEPSLGDTAATEANEIDPNASRPEPEDPSRAEPGPLGVAAVPDGTTGRPDDASPARDRNAPETPARPEDPADPNGTARPNDGAKTTDPATPGADGTRPDSGHEVRAAGTADRTRPEQDPTRPGQNADHVEPGSRPDDPSAAPWSPPAPLSAHAAELSARAEHSDHGLSLFADPVMAALARRVPPDPGGAYDVNLHTDATGGISGFDRVTARDIADLALADGVRPPQKIRLTGCEAGALDDGLAAEVSRLTGCDVIAADSLVWSDEAGHMFASRGTTDGFGRPAPDIPPTGTWHEFHPDGTKTEVGGGGFPPGQESGFGNWHSPVGETLSRGAEQAPWDPPEGLQAHKVPDPSDPALRPLAPGERFSDRPDLPASSRIDVFDPDGDHRGTFFTDENGKITHAELPVPNTRHGEEQSPQNQDPYQKYGLTEQNVIDGSNPDAATPPGDATVKYTWTDGDVSVVFKTDANGKPQAPGIWEADASVPVKQNFKLGPQQSVFEIKPAKLEPNSHYTAEQTPRGETAPRTTDFWTDGNGRVVAVDTWRGKDTPGTADGGWNPNLGSYGRAKGPDGMRFQPGVTFRVDGKVGVTDEFGRMATMSLDDGATLKAPLVASIRNERAQAESNSFGKAEHSSGAWDGGHKYPAAVGGPSEPFNYFPQDRADNEGNGPGAANSWYADEMDTVAAIEYQQAEVTGWDIIENHATGTPARPDADPPEGPKFNKTPEIVIVRKTYRFPQADGTLGPPRTTIRFTVNVDPTAGTASSTAAGAGAAGPVP